MAAAKDSRFAIGIDIGGTGIKAALVDTFTGLPAFKRIRLLTPRPATPVAVANVVAEAVDRVIDRALELGLSDERSALEALPVGCGFPGVVWDSRVAYAPNLDEGWIGCEVTRFLGERIGHHPFVINDADAAGLAEMTFGTGRRHRRKTVLMTTLGTGIGTALFSRGRLVPFTELGHIEIDGVEAETRAAESAKVRDGLDFPAWAARLQEYYTRIELLVAPELIIVGGGISKEHERFLPLISTRAPLRPAKLLNSAGVVGAASFAARGGSVKVSKRS